MTSTSSSPSVHARRRSKTPGELAPRSWPRSLRPTAMASVSTAVPVAVRNVVSSAMVWSTYARLVSKSTAGRIAKCPAPESRMRANTAGASKRGKHSQSTEPALQARAGEGGANHGPVVVVDHQRTGAADAIALCVRAGNSAGRGADHRHVQAGGTRLSGGPANRAHLWVG